MFKPLFKTLVAVLAIAAAAAGPAWGQNASPDVTLDFTTNDWGLPAGKTNITYAANSYTSGDYTITLQGGGSSSNGYYFHNDGYLLLGKNGSYLELPEFESAVDSIVVVGKSGASTAVEQNIYVGGTAVSTQTTGATGTNTYVINENYRAAGNIYTLRVESAQNTQITYIKVYYVSSGGGSGSETPTPGQNSTTYNVTFSGFSYPTLNTTVNVASLPQTFTSNFNPPSVINDVCYGFTGATVTSGGEGNVSASVVTFTEMSITVSGPFEGTATIHVTGKDDEERDISTDVYVSCVAVAPAAPTPHTVRFADGNDGWTVTDVDSARSATAPAVLQNVMAGDSLVVTAPASLPGKVKSVKAVKYVPPEVITWNSTNVFNSDHMSDRIIEWQSGSCTFEGITISKSGEDLSSFYAYDGSAQKGSLACFGNNGDSFTFTAPSGKKFCKIEIIDNEGVGYTNYGDWTGDVINNKIVWSGTAANAVTLGTVYTSALNLNSIVFTLIDAQ